MAFHPVYKHHRSVLQPFPAAAATGNFKCIQIRVQIHIRFFDSGKSFYRRSIKHTFIIQCSLKLAYCNRYILHCSENIGELQPDKSHVFFLDKIQDIFSRIIFSYSYKSLPFLLLIKWRIHTISLNRQVMYIRQMQIRCASTNLHLAHRIHKKGVLNPF